MAAKQRVFIGMPTHNGQAVVAATRALYNTCSKDHYFASFSRSASLLSSNMNTLYCMALNGRERPGFQWFAMLHADIEPADWWVDILIKEAEEHGADFMSAVVPIKDERGVTSTGIAHPDHSWAPYCRLTMQQLNHESFPDTFDLNQCVDALAGLPEGLRVEAPRTRLLVNTGAMVMRINNDWADKCVFTTAERIFKIDGVYTSKVESEDWRFGKMIADFGGKVMCTKKLVPRHYGTGHFGADMTWGMPVDENCLEELAKAEIYKDGVH